MIFRYIKIIVHIITGNLIKLITVIFVIFITVRNVYLYQPYTVLFKRIGIIISPNNNIVIKFLRRFKTNPAAFGCDCSVYCIRIAASVFFTGRFNYFVFLGKHFQQRFQFFFIIRNSCFYIFTWKFCKFVNITVNKSMCNCRNMLRYLVMPHLIRYWLRKKWANSKI